MTRYFKVSIMKNMKHIHFILVLATGIILSGQCSAQVAVVAGSKSAIGTMTKEQVASLYTGNSFVYPSGGTAVLLDQSDGTEARKQFYAKITEKSPSQIKATWSRLTFSGKATPPKELASSADVKKEVSSNPSEIGYIEKSAVDSSVKVLFTTD